MNHEVYKGEVCVIVPFSPKSLESLRATQPMSLMVILTPVDYERIFDSVMFMREVPEGIDFMHSPVDLYTACLQGEGSARMMVYGSLRGVRITREGVRFVWDVANRSYSYEAETETLMLSTLQKMFRA
jgi:hypothetical protein